MLVARTATAVQKTLNVFRFVRVLMPTHTIIMIAAGTMNIPPANSIRSGGINEESNRKSILCWRGCAGTMARSNEE
jgi:hypothetical protein